METGRWTVILEPAAVLDLVGFLFYDFAGTSVADQRSCFNKRMGKKVLGENITLHDDVYRPLQSGAPFDGEGIPRQKVLLVDDLLATGGTAAAAAALVQKLGAQILEASFLIELSFLGGRQKLKQFPVRSLVVY